MDLGLIVVDFVEFYLVNHGGERGDAVGVANEVEGEVEAVLAAGVHQLHGVDEALEHGFAQVVGDGALTAVGFVNNFAGVHVGVGEVEVDTFADGGFGAVAFAEHFVVVAFGGFLDVGVLGQEFFEGFFLFRLRIGLLLGVQLPVVFGDEESDVLACFVVGFFVEGLFFAFEGALEGFQYDFVVEVVYAVFGGLGKTHAHSPAEAVGFVGKCCVFGLVAARCGCKNHCSGEECDAEVFCKG